MKNLFKKNKNLIKPVLSRHCLGTLTTKTIDKLLDGKTCQEKVIQIINSNGAVCLGDQLHVFPNKSFTLLISLVESHVSIHTWPERFTVQVDVFLCNYLQNNTNRCEKIYEEIVNYFDVKEVETSKLDRL